MRKKGEGKTAIYYCKKCDEYYFRAIFDVSPNDTGDYRFEKVTK